MAKPVTEETPKDKKTPLKWAVLALGSVIGIAHIGVLGHLVNVSSRYSNRPDFPAINLPTDGYSSWNVNVNKDGYSVEYKANDPKVLTSEKALDLDKNKKGWFGGGSEKRTEYRYDEYTMDGVRNMGGAFDGEGKSAKEIECIVADAGARSQGAIAGSAIAAGAIAPAVVGIPYIGWLAAGWSALLGQKIGSEVGSEVGSVFNDC